MISSTCHCQVIPKLLYFWHFFPQCCQVTFVSIISRHSWRPFQCSQQLRLICTKQESLWKNLNTSNDFFIWKIIWGAVLILGAHIVTRTHQYLTVIFPRAHFCFFVFFFVLLFSCLSLGYRGTKPANTTETTFGCKWIGIMTSSIILSNRTLCNDGNALVCSVRYCGQ